MQIVDFTREWIPQAQNLIRTNYLEECSVVNALPETPKLPALDVLAENGLGVAAVQEEKLLGFLGAYGPWKPVFCTPNTAGVFSPLHAHAVQRDQRVILWRKLYQAAGEKWVQAGAASHAITLHAHDAAACEALYLYGFGVRCMDLIRPMTGIGYASEWISHELPHLQSKELRKMRRELAAHLAQSPSFMLHEPNRLEAWLNKKDAAYSRIFVAEANGHIAAYMEAEEDGENYAAETAGTMNICGAYCLPEFRGTGAAQAVLEKMISTFQSEGYTRLGVDCESFNPTALGFWSKYFEPYTYSVVRRIDENVIK